MLHVVVVSKNNPNRLKDEKKKNWSTDKIRQLPKPMLIWPPRLISPASHS